MTTTYDPIKHMMTAMDMVFDAMYKPPIFRADPVLGTFVFRWDGVDKLTVDGQRHFAIYVETRQALAEAMFRLACPDEALPTELEVERFCAEVLALLDGKPFTMCSDAVVAWLRQARR